MVRACSAAEPLKFRPVKGTNPVLPPNLLSSLRADMKHKAVLDGTRNIMKPWHTRATCPPLKEELYVHTMYTYISYVHRFCSREHEHIYEHHENKGILMMKTQGLAPSRIITTAHAKKIHLASTRLDLDRRCRGCDEVRTTFILEKCTIETYQKKGSGHSKPVLVWARIL